MLDKTALSDDQLDAIMGGTIIPYVVKQGDNLNALAEKYHVTVEQLMKWNNIKDPNFLTVGQQLKIKY